MIEYLPVISPKARRARVPLLPQEKSFLYGCFLYLCIYTFQFIMSYFVYIIQSEVDNTYYKGYTQNPEYRLCQHNNGESRYTSNKIPWNLVFLEEYQTKKEAIIREKQIKRFNSQYLKKLIENQKGV